jgi:hypothetical protein
MRLIQLALISTMLFPFFLQAGPSRHWATSETGKNVNTVNALAMAPFTRCLVA